MPSTKAVYERGQQLGRHGIKYLEESEPVFYKRKPQDSCKSAGNPQKVRRALFLCGECKNEFCAHINNVRQGYTKCCGCKKLTADGLSRLSTGEENPIHSVWVHMIGRCYNPVDNAFKYYGKRGISICKEWRESFRSFHDWAVSNGYAKGLQIDRRDNDGNYEPSNCRFVTQKVNCRNRRSTRHCWLNGEKMCHLEAAEKLGVNNVTIANWAQGKYPKKVPSNLVFEEPKNAGI